MKLGNTLIPNLIILIYFTSVSNQIQICSYKLHFDLCLRHLAKNETSICDSLVSDLSLVLEELSIEVRTSSLSWKDENLENLEFRVEKSKDKGLQYYASAPVSGVRKDLMRGLSRMVLDLKETNGFSDCQEKKTNSGDETRRELDCSKTSQGDSIYHIQELYSDRKVRKEGGKIKEIFVEEIFSHFSNLNRNLGTQISSNLKLTRSSDCKDGNSILDSVNLVKTDLDESKKENQESNIKEKVKTLDKILKEENVLKRMSELKSAVMNMSETELDKMLKKFKNSAKYHYILESCGAAGTLKVYKAVLKALPPSTSQSGHLERFLISLSFNPNLEKEIIQDLKTILHKYKSSPNIVDTLLNCICKQEGREPQNKEDVEKILNLAARAGAAGAAGATGATGAAGAAGATGAAEVGGLSCSDETCQRRILSCLSALRSDDFSEKILEIVRTGKDKKVRETAATVLLGLYPTDPARRRDLENAVLKHLLENDLGNEEFSKLLEIIDMNSLNRTTINQLFKIKDKERRAYLSQKISSQVSSLQKDYSLLSYATQGESVYVSRDLVDVEGMEGRFMFSTSMSGSSISRTSFSLDILDVAYHKKNLLSIQSFIGGISGFLGDADPEDDKDANANLQLSLLGLPLRPVVLFSSVGDLIELYWSGAGQEKTTLLEGSLPLEENRREWETCSGIRVQIHSNLNLYINSAGEGSVSIWESSGSSNLQTDISVVGSSTVQVLAPGAGFISCRINLETGLIVDTQVQTGQDLAACVKMKSSDLLFNLELDGSKGKSIESHVYPGLTWNLNHKNNMMCSAFSKR